MYYDYESVSMQLVDHQDENPNKKIHFKIETKKHIYELDISKVDQKIVHLMVKDVDLLR